MCLAAEAPFSAFDTSDLQLLDLAACYSERPSFLLFSLLCLRWFRLAANRFSKPSEKPGHPKITSWRSLRGE